MSMSESLSHDAVSHDHRAVAMLLLLQRYGVNCNVLGI